MCDRLSLGAATFDDVGGFLPGVGGLHLLGAVDLDDCHRGGVGDAGADDAVGLLGATGPADWTLDDAHRCPGAHPACGHSALLGVSFPVLIPGVRGADRRTIRPPALTPRGTRCAHCSYKRWWSVNYLGLYAAAHAQRRSSGQGSRSVLEAGV